MSLDEISGRFEGRGTWRDSAGNIGEYAVVQTNRVTENGFEIVQHHDHGDGSPPELRIALTQTVPSIYRVEADRSDGGYGYAIDGQLRFFVDNELGSITEFGYQLKDPLTLAVYGSCTRNSAGDYIYWHEKLERVAPAER